MADRNHRDSRPPQVRPILRPAQLPKHPVREQRQVAWEEEWPPGAVKHLVAVAVVVQSPDRRNCWQADSGQDGLAALRLCRFQASSNQPDRTQAEGNRHTQSSARSSSGPRVTGREHIPSNHSQT